MDEFYNERFAKQVERAVARMDDDEAEMFVRFAAYEIHKADLEANRRLVDARVAEVHHTIAKAVARSLDSLVSKSVDADSVASLVVEVSKGKKKEQRQAKKEFKRQFKQAWDESQVRRDNRGRFTFEHKGHAADEHYGRHVLVPVGDKHFDLTGALGTTNARGNAFERTWNAQPTDERAFTNKRTYERIGAGAKLIHNTGNPKLEAASQLGQFAGRFGPEAEKVVGPHLRKTAYRYRGTERRPDPTLINMTNQMSRDVMRHEETEQLTPAMRTYAAQRAASSYLMSRLPKKNLSELQRQSGKIPPSEGVILNADGQIITQAVGYMDDHYLPFNLKNLKGLQGGHYVRSRSQGGLTAEDIYTGLVSGARSVTVVSRSGVFTIEFEDDFRGGRRYNDKARQMVGRYAHLLDAVQSEKVAQRKLTPEERADIRDEVERMHKDDDFLTSADIEDLIKEKEQEYLARPTLSKDELAEIDAIARKDNSDDERKYKMARAELISQKMEEKKARNYRLDGAGYAAALDALKEQFPYYISTVEYRHANSRDKFDNPFTNETDKGYVMPKHNRPAGAMAGYFAEEVNGRGKVPASQTNYQNWAVNPQNKREKVAESTGEGGEGQEQSATTRVQSAADKKRKRAELAMEGTAKREADKAITEMVEMFRNIKGVDPVIGNIGDDEDAMRSVLSNNAKRNELLHALKKTQGELKSAGVGTSDAAERARDLHARSEVLFRQIKRSEPAGEWNNDLSASPDAPFRFKGEAYSPAAPHTAIVNEYQRMAARAGLPSEGLAPGRLTDRQLRDKAAMYGYVADHIDAPDYNEESFMKGLIDRGMDIKEVTRIADSREQRKPKDIATHFAKKSEAFHRMRSLQHNLDKSATTQQEERKATGTAGFEGVTQGKTKAHLTALNTEKGEKAKQGPKEQFDLDPDLHSAATISTRLGFVQSELAKQGKEEEASVVGAIRGLVNDYARGRIAERDFLLADIQANLNDIKDEDINGELDRWLGSRKFDR